ncbi:marvel domain-containing protein [Achaetomium macrosporum]|uniref:Marvel domain-containing protein n=1 Tax=Achaetomium macrosporum TaxID=79813 RepID=A0AAN7CE60_9PEZI|nr:marvel domain-containing protein [Achaetomium macrosporum]
MHRAIPLGLRTIQFLTAVTILGLAAAMIRAQVFGSAPVTVRYSTFTGGFGILVCLVGVASLFASFIPDLVPLVLDGLAGVLFLAGGIAWAVGLRGVQNCKDPDGMLRNSLLNWGTVGSGDNIGYGVRGPDDDAPTVYNRLRGNCQRAQADEVLQFISVAFALGLIGLGYLQLRRGRGLGGYVA